MHAKQLLPEFVVPLQVIHVFRNIVFLLWIAGVTFDQFHRDSANVIRKAVFGSNADKENVELRFTSNRLVITNVDVQVCCIFCIPFY
jgi:hypothetical protein